MRPFIGYGQTHYIGQPVAAPIKLKGIDTISVPLLFQWISYGAATANPNINVLVELRGQACARLDNIRSIYINNLGSDVPIYVHFEDTQYDVVAKPNSSGWYPVYTNQKFFNVIGLGFLDGNIPQTTILVCNANIMPSVNVEIDTSVPLWLASPTITRGNTIYNTNYGTPALGDQAFSGAIDAIPPAPTVLNNLWGTPYSDDFLYVTGLQIALLTFSSASVGGFAGTVFIESTGVAGILYQFDFRFASTSIINADLINRSAMNLKLDATQTWRMRFVAGGGVTPTGFITLSSEYTINPN